MALLLVRHAVALRRRDWDRPDRFRPLSDRGESQAEALVAQLEPFRISRILSSPFQRCMQTVEPLGRARALPVEEAPELAEGMHLAAVGLADAAAEPGAVLCSHGDVLPALLAALSDGGLGIGKEPPLAKGSTWVLESERGRFTRAHYLPPPK